MDNRFLLTSRPLVTTLRPWGVVFVLVVVAGAPWWRDHHLWLVCKNKPLFERA